MYVHDATCLAVAALLHPDCHAAFVRRLNRPTEVELLLITAMSTEPMT